MLGLLGVHSLGARGYICKVVKCQSRKKYLWSVVIVTRNKHNDIAKVVLHFGSVVNVTVINF